MHILNDGPRQDLADVFVAWLMHSCPDCRRAEAEAIARMKADGVPGRYPDGTVIEP